MRLDGKIKTFCSIFPSMTSHRCQQKVKISKTSIGESPQKGVLNFMNPKCQTNDNILSQKITHEMFLVFNFLPLLAFSLIYIVRRQFLQDCSYQTNWCRTQKTKRTDVLNVGVFVYVFTSSYLSCVVKRPNVFLSKRDISKEPFPYLKSETIANTKQYTFY